MNPLEKRVTQLETVLTPTPPHSSKPASDEAVFNQVAKSILRYEEGGYGWRGENLKTLLARIYANTLTQDDQKLFDGLPESVVVPGSRRSTAGLRQMTPFEMVAAFVAAEDAV